MNFLASLGGAFKGLGGLIKQGGGYLKNGIGHLIHPDGASAPATNPADAVIPRATALPNLSINTRTPAILPTESGMYANPLESLNLGRESAPPDFAPAREVRQLGRTPKDEFRMRMGQPDAEVQGGTYARQRMDNILRDGYDPEHVTGKQRATEALWSAVRNANNSYQRTGRIQDAVGGAITGGAAGAIAPTMSRELGADEEVGKQFGRDQIDYQRQKQESEIQDAGVNRDYKRAGIDNMRADNERQAEQVKANNEYKTKRAQTLQQAQDLKERLAKNGKFDKIQTIYNPDKDTYDTIGFNPTTGEQVTLGENGKIVSQEYLGEKRIEQSNTNNIRTTTTSANNNAATNATRGAIANQANQQKYNSQNQRDAARMAELKAQGKWKDDGGGNSGGRVLNGLQGAAKTISADAFAQAVRNDFGGDEAKARAELQRRGYVIK